jgi:Rps23 Pro-64 3,4-dihydroxylase Tpa1-like proline 4-hydroxylase
MASDLFALNPALDRPALAAEFARVGRIQVRDVLTAESARELRAVLAQHTRWGMAMSAAHVEGGKPRYLRAEALATEGGRQQAQAMGVATIEAAAQGRYAYRYASYPMLEAYLGRWDEGSPHDLLLEHLNAPDFLQLARDVTGMDDLVKADAQATLYAGQHFLALHNDSHVEEQWRIAYVLNLTSDDWRPDWGGYLVFYDEEGDIVQGFRPRFNALNMFRVPMKHAVTFVPPFAPVGRFAVTGWLRAG